MQRLAKRLIYLVVSILVLVVCFPLMIVVSCIILKSMGFPIFFRQLRPGKNSKLFNLVKFRTMTLYRDANGKILADASRLTRLGQFLRSTSIDELPQLVNVLKGEMSLVGPRPLLQEYLGRYSPEQARRHDVTPGITGWAQINGRNNLSWEEKFKLDVWYVDNWSLLLDLKIIFLSLIRVLSKRDINQVGHATVEEFKGSNPLNYHNNKSMSEQA